MFKKPKFNAACTDEPLGSRGERLEIFTLPPPFLSSGPTNGDKLETEGDAASGWWGGGGAN